MSITLSQARQASIGRLSENNTAQYHQLTDWINAACRDIARRAECLQSLQQLPVIEGTQKYILPSELVRVHRMEFNPTGQQNIYPLEARGLMEMDQIWGINQTNIFNYPCYYALWQNPPTLQAILYPVPSTSGSLNCYYYRLPTPVSLPSDNLDIPEGWEDMVYMYVEYVAMRKDMNPAWQSAKEIYEEQMMQLIDRTQSFHDQSGMITTGTSMVPDWLYAGNGYW
ncbi:MAG: DUF6682 family protein [Candidatus Micrarchaeaceae archaeon]